MNLNLRFRVMADHGTSFLVSADGEQMFMAQMSGNLKKSDGIEQPTVGDWVLGSYQPGDWIFIESVDTRMNLLSRQSADGRSPQKLGANIDFLFVATAVIQDFNLNRLDRYVAMALGCQIQPVILLTKIDLVENPEDFLNQTAERFPDIDIHAVSSLEGWNLECLGAYLQQGYTVAIVGSSGVGKSTLVNTLLGQQVLETGGIREDDGKGRHTTSHRSLHLTVSGAWLMDTPGLRGLALWDSEEGLQSLFEDIEALGLACKFSDCRHQTEPGCQINRALESGELSEERWRSYLKLKAEEAHQRRKVDKVAASEEKKKWKSIHKQVHQYIRTRRR